MVQLQQGVGQLNGQIDAFRLAHGNISRAITNLARMLKGRLQRIDDLLTAENFPQAQTAQEEAEEDEAQEEEEEAAPQVGGQEPEDPEEEDDEEEVENKQHFNKQSKEELLKSKASYERLVQEHKKKLDNYVKNPDAYDHKGLLRGIPEEIKKMRIEGRIRELQSQIRRQERDLRIINRLLKKI